MLRVSGLTLTDKSEHSEQVKKVFKHLVDIGRKIEEKHQSADKVEDVFTVELLSLRTRLKDLVLRMLTLDPKKSGTKVFDHFWRKCYHEPYSLVRQLRGTGWSKHQLSLIQSHLLSGIGTYQNMILFLTEKFGWNSDFSLDFSIINTYGWTTFGDVRSSAHDGDEDGVDQVWVEGTVFRCLVWLGDLARYLETDLTHKSPVSATRFYKLATQLCPDSGQPYNNLAMLIGDKNHLLDQLYLYLKCVCCSSATDNGKANLKRMLEKPAEFGSDEQNLVSGLLQLVKIVFDGGSQEQVTAGCQHSLACLHAGLEKRDQLELTGAWLSTVVSVVILLVQVKAEPVCQAWLMAFMSHLAGKIVSQVLDKYPQLEVKEEAEEDTPDIIDNKVENVKKPKKNKLENLLRRRRTRGQSGSEGEDSDESSDEIVESEEDPDNDDDEEFESSDGFQIDSSSDEEDDDDDVVVEEEEEATSATQRDLVDVSNDELLPAFLLCFTWLKQHPFLLAQTGHGSEQMWTNLTNIFNLLNTDQRDALEMSDEVEECLNNVENVAVPLPEDWMIRGHNKDEDKTRNWSQTFHNNFDEKVMRLVRVGQFRDWICQHPDSKITWDKEKKLVRFKKDVEASDKKNVMKHMAELWLKQEVKDLEKEAGRGGGMIIVDSGALVNSLAMVKRVLGLRKFTIVVPMTVVQQLDSLKKNERGAREAIRWLERELSRGNKWLRAQKQDEVSSDDQQTRNVSKHQAQLLQCLAYFVSKTGNITLLTSDTDMVTGDLEMFGSMKKNISVEHVEGFVPRVLGIKDKRVRKGRGRKRRDSDNVG